jgi:hypothetical protein
MKLIPAAALALSQAVRAQLPGYASTCENGLLHIDIPYASETTSDLLSFTAGSCADAGPSSLVHSYSYDPATLLARLSIDIQACGLAASLYNTPYIVRQGEFYMATANVTLGVSHNSNDLIFYNAVLGAECGSQVDYQVTFDYAQQISLPPHHADCQPGPNGECIVPAFEWYNFTLTEWTDDSYTVPTDASTRQVKAGELIYLKIDALNLPADKKFAIKTCNFVDSITGASAETYNMFDPQTSVCDNRNIDLDWAYAADEHSATLQHRLFLLRAGDQDSYQLVCDVKVCNRDDLSSDCNAWSACLEPAAQDAYVCDSQTCPAGQNCGIDSSSHATCWLCGCANGVDDSSCSSTGTKCASCNSGYTLSNDQCVLNVPSTAGQLCVTIAIHPTDGAASMDEIFYVYINDGDSNTITFPAQSYGNGDVHTECIAYVGSKTTADIQSVRIEATDNDGGFFSKLEISYDGAEAVTYGMGHTEGFWIDGDNCPGSPDGGLTDDLGYPCCSNQLVCDLSPQTFSLRLASQTRTTNVQSDE